MTRRLDLLAHLSSILWANYRWAFFWVYLQAMWNLSGAQLFTCSLFFRIAFIVDDPLSNWCSVCWYVPHGFVSTIKETEAKFVSVTEVDLLLCLPLCSIVVFPSRKALHHHRMVLFDGSSSPWLVCKESKHSCTLWPVRIQWRGYYAPW